jgi:hypothetical protein
VPLCQRKQRGHCVFEVCALHAICFRAQRRTRLCVKVEKAHLRQEWIFVAA